MSATELFSTLGRPVVIPMYDEELRPDASVARLLPVSTGPSSSTRSSTSGLIAESITVALAVAAGLALSGSMLGGPRAAGWRWLAAALALGTAYARPIYQILLPLFAAFGVALHVRRRPAALARHATPFVVAGLVGLLSVYLVDAVVKGVPAFVPVAGHCLANYLGDRRLLGVFPPGEAVEALYSTRFAVDPGKVRIPWWAELLRTYRHDILNLQDLTGRDLSPWLRA